MSREPSPRLRSLAAVPASVSLKRAPRKGGGIDGRRGARAPGPTYLPLLSPRRSTAAQERAICSSVTPPQPRHRCEHRGERVGHGVRAVVLTRLVDERRAVGVEMDRAPRVDVLVDLQPAAVGELDLAHRHEVPDELVADEVLERPPVRRVALREGAPDRLSLAQARDVRGKRVPTQRAGTTTSCSASGRSARYFGSRPERSPSVR